MITDEIRQKLDPEVYEFYKAVLDGPGFDVPFTAADVAALREDEEVRHAASTETYVCSCFDLVIDREDADPLPVRIYTPNKSTSAKPNPNTPNKGTSAVNCGTPGECGSAKGLLATDNATDEAKPDPSARHIFSVGAPGADLPVLLYFHGGGFVMGSIYDHDPLCGKLADEFGAIVISVEYRLAPEFPFPACIDDARDAFFWAHEHARDFGGDPDRIMAGGDSSGANIATALAMMLRDEAKNAGDASQGSPTISKLILFYGVFGCLDLDNSESAKEFGDGRFLLPTNTMNTFMELYLPKDKFPDGIYTDDYRLAPGRGTDLAGMPPSIIVSAEFDPLRDDGELFAKKLKEASCDVKLIRMDGFMHGFVLYWQHFSRVEKLLKDIGALVRKNKS